ncbi:MAG: hypothetical protein WBK94_00015 [Tenuifilaceae bacterium]
MGAIRRPTRRSTGRGFDFASPTSVSFSLGIIFIQESIDKV